MSSNPILIRSGLLRRGLSMIAVALLSLIGACIASELSNGFDLKGPRSILIGFLGAPACVYDGSLFDGCSFGP
ncbi:MAG: hypothetical protein K1X75_04005 [Leptospirales bacterium]|nr:hypothetical protein [Leptospirales bacterium]